MFILSRVNVAIDKDKCDTYSCSHCGYCISGKDASKHSKTCGLCEKQFSKNEHLKKHLKTHRYCYHWDACSNELKCIDLFKKHISYNLVSHLKLQSRWMRKLVLKILLVLATHLINVFHLSKLFNCNKTYSNSLMDILNRISAASPFMAIFLALISCH